MTKPQTNSQPDTDLHMIAEEARAIRKNIEEIMADFMTESKRIESSLDASEKNVNKITSDLNALDQETEDKIDSLILEEADELGKE